MIRSQQPAQTAFAVGMIGLGVLALRYGDFALVWQPVAPWVPGRTFLAYCAGLIMLICGVGLFFNKTAPWSVRILQPYLVIWLLLKVPAIVVAPQVEAVWLGLGELTVLAAGGWILFANLAELPTSSRMSWITSTASIRSAQLIFGLSLIPIGLSHIMYVQQTAALVPAWLPYRVGWAYLTGAGQMACGLGVLLSILPQVAAFVETAMLALFTLLVWIPAILAAPRTRLPWTAFFISWVITSAAWAVAQSTLSKQKMRSSDPQNAEHRLIATHLT